MSIFSENAKKYWEAGYSVLPIQPGSKRPGFDRGDRKILIRGWQDWCKRQATREDASEWLAKVAEAGIGIALGYNNVVAIDLDYGTPLIMEAIESCLPGSEYKKVGAKGYTEFYRTEQPMKAKKFNLKLEEGGKPVSVCEVLSTGNQTVIPPTIHPDTKQAYRWEGDPLCSVAPSQLPVLPASFVEDVKAALAPFGYAEKAPHKIGDIGESNDECDGDDYENIYQTTNREALEDLERWVHLLHRVDIDPEYNGEGYRIMAAWRDGDGYNIGIHPSGIRDFTGKDGNAGGMSAIDLVALMNDLDPTDAMCWLWNIINAEFSIMMDEMAANGLAEAEANKARNDAALEQFLAKQSVVQAEAERIAAEPVDPSDLSEFAKAMIAGAVPANWQVGTPNEITDRADGLIGDLVEYLTGISKTPSKTIALTAALGISGLLFGRWWARKSGVGRRTFANIYVFGSAGSGMGKSSTMSAARRMYDEAIDVVMQDPRYADLKAVKAQPDVVDKDGVVVEKPDQKDAPLVSTIMKNSYYGKVIHAPATLQNRMIDYPNTLMFVDEASQFVRKVWPANSNNNADGMQRQLKMLITEADWRAEGTDYSSKEKNQSDVEMPGFSLVLMSTGDELVKSLPFETYRDGMLGRVLWLQDDAESILRFDTNQNLPLHNKIVTHMASILRTRLDADELSMGGFAFSGVRYDPAPVAVDDIVLRKERSAEVAFHGEGVRAAKAKRADSELWHRALEVSMRASLLHALGRDHINPVVQDIDVEFGLRLATASIQRLAQNADDAEGLDVEGAAEYSKMEARVVKIVSKNGGSITVASLSKKLHIKRKICDDLVATMVGANVLKIAPGSRANSTIVSLV